MPKVSMVDPTSDAKRIRYISDDRGLRLQLAATRDSYDNQTGQKIPGRTVVADFKDHIFETNKEDIVEMMEKSIAYQQGLIVREDKLIQEAKEKRYETARELLANDPDLVERLKADLRKQAAEAKEQEELSNRDVLELKGSKSQDTQVKDL